MKTILERNNTILFQGDSITDGGRSRNEDKNHVMGHGYAYITAARLSADYPELNLKFINRGCSGNHIVEMYARWREDAVNLKPNVISILIGINGVGREINRGAGIPAGKYENVYRMLLDETLDALPEVTFVLCEPFVLRTKPVDENWDAYRREVDLRRTIVERLSSEYDAIFVPLQEVLDDACTQQDVDYWLWDGVHPMPAGHELIARAWMNAACRTPQMKS
jgi:lysophospholipase L1-like esterase